MEENKNLQENLYKSNEELHISDVIKCPFCGSINIEPSMFIEEWDCNNCLKPFKKKDFL